MAFYDYANLFPISSCPQTDFCALVTKRADGSFYTKQLVFEEHEDYYTGRIRCVERNGKIVFPKKEDADKLCIGMADICIQEDKGNYAIARMTMVRYPSIEDSHVLDFCLRNIKEGKIHGDNVIEIRKQSLKGDYVVIRGNTIPMVATLTPCALVVNHNEYCDNNDHAKSVVTTTVAEFIANQTGSKSVSDYKSNFVSFKFENRFDNKTDKYVSDLFDEAVSFGLFSMKQKVGYPYASIDDDCLAEAIAYFSDEELTQVIEEASKLNRYASEHIIGKIKKGQLSMSMI